MGHTNNRLDQILRHATEKSPRPRFAWQIAMLFLTAESKSPGMTPDQLARLSKTDPRNLAPILTDFFRRGWLTRTYFTAAGDQHHFHTVGGTVRYQVSGDLREAWSFMVSLHMGRSADAPSLPGIRRSVLEILLDIGRSFPRPRFAIQLAGVLLANADATGTISLSRSAIARLVDGAKRYPQRREARNARLDRLRQAGETVTRQLYATRPPETAAAAANVIEDALAEAEKPPALQNVSRVLSLFRKKGWIAVDYIDQLDQRHATPAKGRVAEYRLAGDLLMAYRGLGASVRGAANSQATRPTAN